MINKLNNLFLYDISDLEMIIFIILCRKLIQFIIINNKNNKC